jgi:hypothetical protein
MSIGSIAPPAAAVAGAVATPAPTMVGPSPRLRLARLARDAALRDSGVVALDAGTDGRFAVVSGDERIDGVLCVATADGGYDVELRLVCALVPLVPLGERVRAKVRETAAVAEVPLATVSVHVAAVAMPEGS